MPKMAAMLTFLFMSSLMTAALSAPGDSEAEFFRKDYTFLREQNAFYKFHKVKQSFNDAVATCSAEGAQLMIPRSKPESEKVYQLVPTNVEYFWIGLHDMFGEAIFITLDGENADDFYTNWGAGEPNNSGNGEDCVGMRRDTTYNDGTCAEKNHFVCKRSAIGLTRNLQCETYDLDYSFFDATDSCYKLHKTPRTWRDAFKICRAEEAELVVINSEVEDQHLVRMIRSYPLENVKGNFDRSVIHVGFNDLINEGVHLTVKGQPLSETGYERWANGQPDDQNGEDCGSIFMEGSLNDVNCNARALFICEKPLTNTASPHRKVALPSRIVDV